jgi:type IV pilus assembly protein PilE
MKRPSAVLGFTLVELMAVVLIVAVLTLFAVPSYRQYVLRSQRTEAKTALLRAAANQERFYLINTEYTDDLTKLGFSIANGAQTEHGRYTLNVELEDDNQSFTITANAANEMLDDGDCQEFTIDVQGLRGASPDPHDNCW